MKKQSEAKFKIGDRVEYLPEYEGDKLVGFGTIVEMPVNRPWFTVRAEIGEQNILTTYERFLRHAPAAPKPRFAVGDRVVFHPYEYVDETSFGRIVGTCNEIFDIKEEGTGYSFGRYAYELLLARAPAVVESAPKFAVGDRVVDEGGTGDAGVVESIKDDFYFVTYDGNDRAACACRVEEGDAGWLVAEMKPVAHVDVASTDALKGVPTETLREILERPVPTLRELEAGWRMYYDDSSARRKDQPVFEGFLEYFPAAVRLAAELSRLGNDQHNPGQEMHHARSKSTDQGNCIVRHQMNFKRIDEKTQLAEAVAVFWRAGAQLQILAETKYGWPKAPRAK